MKKKIFALLTALCMTAAVLPAMLPAVFADGEGEATIGMSEQEQCSCVVLCTEDNKNPDCPVCSAEGADLSACKGEPVQPVLLGAPKAVEVEINEINFPDQTFRNYVASEFDENNNGTLSADELNSVTEIDVNGRGVAALTRGLYAAINHTPAVGERVTVVVAPAVEVLAVEEELPAVGLLGSG